MSEENVVARTSSPVTVRRLIDDLVALGVRPGMVLLVHSKMSGLGWIAGGPVAIVQALMQVLTPEGSLAMPTHSTDLSDPEPWAHPAVPKSWWPIIRNEVPAYDPRITPTRGMGRVVECFRTWPGVLRSRHPLFSWAAWGHHAEVLISNHTFEMGMGEGSPLARAYELDAQVALLGVDHGRNTSLHLAEYRASWPSKELCTNYAPIIQGDHRERIAMTDVALDSNDFPAIGESYAASGRERRGPLGEGVGRLMSQRAIVDHAVRWIEINR